VNTILKEDAEVWKNRVSTIFRFGERMKTRDNVYRAIKEKIEVEE